MGYQKKGFYRIQYIIDKLDGMTAGQVLTVRQPDQVVLGKIRTLLYAYLYQMRLKPLFKVTQPSPDFLQIIRAPDLSSEISVGGQSSLAQSFVLDYLLDIDNEDEAIKIVREHIDKSLWIETLAEWRRICGKLKPIETDEASSCETPDFGRLPPPGGS